MTPDSDRPGWCLGHYADLFLELEERAGERIDLPVLSVTKSRGPMLASERFGKVMHGRDLSRYRRAPKDHVVADPMLLWDGSIGLQSVVDLGLVSPDYRVYAPTTNADPSFAGFLVRSPSMLPFYQGGARGTNVRRNRIARSDFLGIPVGIPPLPEQRKIAAILSSVDEAIEGTQAVIDQLQVLKKAMMADLLTRGIPGRHKTFKQTEIGEIPMGWKAKAVEQVGDVDVGKARDPRAEGTPRPYLRVANVFDGEIRVDDVNEMPFTDSEFERFRLEEGDVLLNEGQSIELVGRCSIYRNELTRPCAIQNALLRFRASGPVRAEFAEQYFRWCQYSGRFAEIATQTTSIAHLGLKRFASMPMPVPTPEEQTKIIEILSAIDGRCRNEQAALAGLKITKSALMSVLLTGEVRVKVEEETVA